MDIQFLAEADAVTLRLEKAKRALELAKQDLEGAKKHYDELLARSDDMGIPKNKLKKLTEDRIHSLFENGLLEFAEPRATKDPKPKKAKSKLDSGESDSDTAHVADVSVSAGKNRPAVEEAEAMADEPSASL